jgi:outer membrane protein assembly factor BamB
MQWTFVRSAVLLTTATVLVAGCGWAQYRAGPEGTGSNAVESTLTRENVPQLAPAWSRQVGWTDPDLEGSDLLDTYSPLARSGNDLAVASYGGSVVLDATTGAVRATIAHSSSFPSRDRSVAIADGRVVITGNLSSTPAGGYSVHDLATGSLIRQVGGCNAGPSAPVISAGRIFFSSVACVGTHETSVSSRRLDDGSGTWGVWSWGGTPAFAPAVAGGLVYFREFRPGQYDTRLAAFDAETGERRWATPVASSCGPTAPAVSGGRVYASGETFDAATGAKLWSWPTCAASHLVTVTASTLFVPYRSATGANRLQAVDARTGAALWSVPWPVNLADLPSLPAAANGLLFAADGNKLVARDAFDGDVLWRSPAITGTFSDPIVSDGMVYAMAGDGAVHAYALP